MTDSAASSIQPRKYRVGVACEAEQTASRRGRRAVGSSSPSMQSLAEAAASARPPNGRTITACATGRGTVLSTTWSTRASVPSDPLISRARLIPGRRSWIAKSRSRLDCSEPRASICPAFLALAMEIVQLAYDQFGECGGFLVTSWPGDEPEIGDFSLGEDDAELLDLVAHGPESPGPYPGRVNADHPPSVPVRAFTGTGSTRRPSGASSALRSLERDPGLHDHAITGDLQHLAEMPAEVDDQAVPQASAAGVGSRTPGVQRNSMFGGIAHHRDHVVLGSRYDNSQRVNLVKTGVVCERGTVHRLEIELTGQGPSQVIKNSGTTFIHGRDAPQRERRELVTAELSRRLWGMLRPRLWEKLSPGLWEKLSPGLWGGLSPRRKLAKRAVKSN